MESAEHYYNKDGWPPEPDRPIMIRLASEIPVIEVNFILTACLLVSAAINARFFVFFQRIL